MAFVMSQVSSTHSHVSWPKARTACVASKDNYIRVLERVNGCLGDGLRRNCGTTNGAE